MASLALMGATVLRSAIGRAGVRVLLRNLASSRLVYNPACAGGPSLSPPPPRPERLRQAVEPPEDMIPWVHEEVSEAVPTHLHLTKVWRAIPTTNKSLKEEYRLQCVRCQEGV